MCFSKSATRIHVHLSYLGYAWSHSSCLILLKSVNFLFFYSLSTLPPVRPPSSTSRFLPNAYRSQDSPPLDSRCCYCYTCTTHRPSLLPLHSASTAAQVLPCHPHLTLSRLHFLILYSFYPFCLELLFYTGYLKKNPSSSICVFKPFLYLWIYFCGCCIQYTDLYIN